MITDFDTIDQMLSEMHWSDEPLEVPLSYVLCRANESVDFGSFDMSHFHDESEWLMDIFARKAADTGFGYLVDSILTDGWDEESVIGFNHRGTITEGHHRLTAAVLLCLDSILISPYGNEGSKYICAHGAEADQSDYPIYL